MSPYAQKSFYKPPQICKLDIDDLENFSILLTVKEYPKMSLAYIAEKVGICLKNYLHIIITTTETKMHQKLKATAARSKTLLLAC